MQKIGLGFCLLFLSVFVNAQKPFFRLSNKLNIAREHELVILKRSFIEEKTGKMAPGKFVEFLFKGETMPSQLDDLNGDGNWDEAVLLPSFRPLETKKFEMSIVNINNSKASTVKAHVRHRKKLPDDSFGPVILKDTMPPGNPPTDFEKVPLPPFLTEGPAWENDKVAFRLYFDTRNGKDVFGKRIPGMVMDTIGANHNNSYHELADWGMDVLHVGKSLGAGSVAIATKDENGRDTLIRLGGKAVRSQTYEVLADGPLRAMFRIRYQWMINGKPVIIIDETSIWGGQYFYESRLKIAGVPAGSKLVAGFANFYHNEEGRIEKGKVKILYSYGPQSENKDNLGLAISVPASTFAGYKKLDPGEKGEIKDSYLVYQNISKQALNYRLYAGWEKSEEQFATKKGFEEYLANQAMLRSSPVVIE